MNAAIVSREGVLRWPAERFFFAVLDVSKLPRATRRRTDTLGFLFESSLPLPIDHVQAVYVKLDRDRVLACGITKEVLRTEVPKDVVALVPEAVPPFLSIDIQAERLNVLVGEFAPEPVLRVRRRTASTAYLAFAAALLLFVAGVERRIALNRAATEDIESERARLLDVALGPARAGVLSAQRQAALIGEKRRLERTRTASDSESRQEPDGASRLSSVLRAWETEVSVEVDAITVGAGSVAIRGSAEDAVSAQDLARSLGRVDGLLLEQPQFQTGTDGRAQFTIRMVAPLAKTP